MHELWAASKLGGITAYSMAVIGNLEGANISVTVALTCAIFISGIVWWLASRFQRIADNQERIAENQRDLAARMQRIEQVLNTPR